MGSLEIKLLGEFNLRLDNLPLTDLKSHKGKALFCYLAVTGKRVSRSKLAGFLWPDMPETQALMNLRKVLTRIKPLFPYLRITRTELSFRQDVPHWLDTAEFERQASKATEITCLQEAVNIYQGDFLDGFYLDHVPLFEEWMIAQRAHLRELAINTLDSLITQLSNQGAYDVAIPYTRQLLAIEPWHESAYRELMRFLVFTGQRSAALLEYENCRHLLAEELSIDPDPATVDLYEQIINGELDGMVSSNSQSAAFPAAQSFHNLPVQTTPFIGRDRELAALSNFLSNADIRLVTILGPGGIGKTRLGLAAAKAQLGGSNPPPIFPQGVFFISLARLKTADLLVPAIAEAIGFHFSERIDLIGQLLRYLQNKSMLLVLDNFEHLLDGVGLLDDILRTAPGIKLLVTSRIRLNRQAEQLFLIQGMDYPQADMAADLDSMLDFESYSALQLFVQNARRVRPTFTLTRQNLPVILEICDLVQGMPLGIVLAAAWVGSLSTAEVMAEMRRDLDFLVSELGDIPERQRSLRAAFNHSWRLLSASEQDIFRQLSVFRGGFTYQAAQTVAGASYRDLQALVNKSLLTLLPGGRYEMHELLCQYADEMLTGLPGLAGKVCDRHSAYYCDWLHQHTEQWHTNKQLETLTAVTLESDNIERAWRWAVENCKWDYLIQAVESWGLYLRWKSRFEDGESFCEAIIDQIKSEDAQVGLLTPICARLWAVAIAWYGQFAQVHSIAIARFERSLALLERPELKGQDCRREKAFAIQGLASRYYDLDRRKERKLLDQSLSLYLALGDSWGIANTQIRIGQLDWGTGHYDEAQQQLTSGLATLEKLGNYSERAAGLDTLAWLHQHLGNLDEAERLRWAVLDLVGQLGDRSQLAFHTANLAYTLIWKGEFEQALQWGEKSLYLGQEYGRQGDEGFLMLAIGLPAFLAGHYQVAQVELNQALVWVKAIESQGVRATVHWSLGSLYLVKKSYQEAEAEFIISQELYQQVQDNLLGFALSGLGYTYYFMNDLQKSRSYILDVLNFALEFKDYIHLIITLPVAALCLTRMGQTWRAIQVWELARTQPFIANSDWYQQVVAPDILAAASNLSPEEVEKARATGREIPLWGTAEILIREIELGVYETHYEIHPSLK